MKHCVLMSLLLALGCMHTHGVPVQHSGVEQGSCEDASALSAARLALTKINQDRKEGYIFSLHRLSNVHTTKHGENSMVFYLTVDVVETNCHVLSRADWETCQARPVHDTPTYGQCKVAIFISKVHRVVRLYKYNCVLRPVPASRLHRICPDCSSLIPVDGDQVKNTVSLSLEKFNKESGLANQFAVLKVTRARAGMILGMNYIVEYSIQETTCAKSTEAGTTHKCPLMECEFAHKGFCKATLHQHPTEGPTVTVDCQIYEPEAANREKEQHLLAGQTDHSHNDTLTHSHDHDHAHAADKAHVHDHAHDHTKSHAQHDDTHKHSDHGDHDDHHHHTHDHEAGSAHRHAHDHSHDHGHGHDHVHTHHAKAHNHTGDLPNQHHGYKHADGVDTHEHDHELALDHDHKHAHLHDHEHHHHHHNHEHETAGHDHPQGTVRILPSMDQPMTLPSFPDVPAAGPEVGVTLQLKPDPQIPGEKEPTIQPFPTSTSSQCPPPAPGSTIVEKFFAEDPLFKPAA